LVVVRLTFELFATRVAGFAAGDFAFVFFFSFAR
jgi:hypothetical protein